MTSGGVASGETSFVPEIYFPLESGRFWVYLEDGAIERTDIVLEGVELVGGVPTKVVEVQGGRFSGHRTNFTNDASGLRIHKLFEAGPDGGSLIFSPPVPVSNAVMAFGGSVTGSGTVEVTGLGTFDYSSDSMVVGPETVFVPAGTFDAVKLESTLTISGMSILVSETDINWFAAHVGIVKALEDVGGGNYMLELVPEPSRDALAASALAVLAGLAGMRGRAVAAGSIARRRPGRAVRGRSRASYARKRWS